MNEEYVSVDVETSGPVPGIFSLLSIGACLVGDPSRAFYAELRPESGEFDEGALEVSGLSIDHLLRDGEPAADAFERFASWVEDSVPAESTPVFVAFNAPFDWMFVADGFHRHLGRNPFGHKALDIKALAMAVDRVGWLDTSFAAVASRYGFDRVLPHHALEDARLQAVLLRRILDRLDQREE